MSTTRTINNLALVGFMGTGKSSVGRLLADELQFSFVDTDHLIEGRVGLSISAIFANQGEAVFRRLEADVVQEFTTERDLVISTGGGLVINPDNMASLKTHALVVCLWAAPETIFERIRTQTHRPLLQTEDPLGKIREMLAVRAPFYRQADVLIHTEMRPPRDVVQQVLHQYYLARRPRP